MVLLFLFEGSIVFVVCIFFVVLYYTLYMQNIVQNVCIHSYSQSKIAVYGIVVFAETNGGLKDEGGRYNVGTSMRWHSKYGESCSSTS